jgi:hypothetical protein
MKTLMTLLSMVLMSNSALAASEPLIALTAQAEPGKVATLGVITDSKNEITGIYYKGADGKTINFSNTELSKSQVLYRKKGYDIAFIRVPYFGKTYAALNFSFTKNVFSSDAEDVGARHFSISYNYHINKYEITDEKERPFSQAYVTTHRNMIGLAVGIDEIQTK